jgi:23S rRNA (guanosine2251-2'-O)-methyltransferase
LVSAYEYVSVDDILSRAQQKGESPFVIICDKITDPHNLGAIIRTANCVGATGVIIPKRNSVGVNSVVMKTSVGAAEYTPVAKVTNIAATIDELKEKGLWITAADMDGQSMYDIDFKGAIALVIGSEGNGISRLVREKCDFIASIPMKGEINSLNASVAGAVLMYEALRQRL